MYAKNAVAAELLTLRSEFEKSSATYDKEIEGLKELVERVRAQAAEASSKWEAAVSRKNQLDVSCLTARGELQRATKKRDYEQKESNRPLAVAPPAAAPSAAATSAAAPPLLPPQLDSVRPVRPACSPARRRCSRAAARS